MSEPNFKSEKFKAAKSAMSLFEAPEKRQRETHLLVLIQHLPQSVVRKLNGEDLAELEAFIWASHEGDKASGRKELIEEIKRMGLPHECCCSR